MAPGTDGGSTVDIDRWAGIIGEQTVRARWSRKRSWLSNSRKALDQRQFTPEQIKAVRAEFFPTL